MSCLTQGPTAPGTVSMSSTLALCTGQMFIGVETLLPVFYLSGSFEDFVSLNGNQFTFIGLQGNY